MVSYCKIGKLSNYKINNIQKNFKVFHHVEMPKVIR